MMVRITTAIREALQAHASDTYPEECCGIIVERAGRLEAVRVTNVQNDLHAQDPAQFPRTAATAYTMGREAVPVLLAADRGEVALYAIYHSHPDHDAYFSAEDRTQALGGMNEPQYPQASHIVLSVRHRVVGAMKAFAWRAPAQEFVEVPLVIAAPD